ncbi:Protein angel 2 [Chamberlinius hualienensis]
MWKIINQFKNTTRLANTIELKTWEKHYSDYFSTTTPPEPTPTPDPQPTTNQNELTYHITIDKLTKIVHSLPKENQKLPSTLLVMPHGCNVSIRNQLQLYSTFRFIMQRRPERTRSNPNSVDSTASRNYNSLLHWPVTFSLTGSSVRPPLYLNLQNSLPSTFYQYRQYMCNKTMNKAQELPSPVSEGREDQNAISRLKRPSTSSRESLNSAKITCSDGNGFLTEKEIVMSLKRARKWEMTDLGVRQSRERNSGLEVTVMSYNVLAQCLLEENSYLYGDCQDFSLQWDYRKVRLVKEIQHLAADIICLQEVQQDHYDEFFVPELHKLGYSAVYKKRTGSKNDGCAIFFRKSKLKLLEMKLVEFCLPSVRLLDRDNVGMVVVFQPVNDVYKSKLCVANTHLLFNPGRGDIKLAQSKILLAEIDRMAFHRLSQSGKPFYHPVIMCGDFNSEPHCYLYRFITKGNLHYEGLIAGDISGQTEGIYRGRFPLSRDIFPSNMGISNNCQYFDTIRQRTGSLDDHSSTSSNVNNDGEAANGTLSHRLNFVSAYKHMTSRSSSRYQPEVTSQQSRNGCTVDYIFYSVQHKKSLIRDHQVVHRDLREKSLMLLGTYRLLIPNELQSVGSLPNAAMPSDHLPLAAKFLLRDQ